MLESVTTIVRQYEQVIDAGYRTFPIFLHPVDIALYGLLAVYDSYIVCQTMVDEANDGRPISVGQAQVFKSHGEGLVWAVRWLLESKHVPDACPVATDDVITEAAELVKYGATYFLVGIMYSHFGKGEVQADVDAAAKHVRFDYTTEYRRLNCSWGFHDDVSNETLGKGARDERRVASLILRAAQNKVFSVSLLFVLMLPSG